MLLALANAAVQINPPGEIDQNQAKNAITGILLILISLVLGWLTFKSLLGDAKKGDYKSVANVAIACVLAMIPLALGAGVAVAMGYGAMILNFVTSIIT